MPNWCFNKLTIRGDPDRLSAFKKANRGEHEEMAFQMLVPMPEKFDADEVASPRPPEEGVSVVARLAGVINGRIEPKDWHEWRLVNWGTKWEPDVGSVLFSPEARVLVYKFDTAWSPPYQWLKKVAAIFQELAFRLEYYEPGNGFSGYVTFELGKEMAAHQGDFEGCFDCHSKDCYGDCPGPEPGPQGAPQEPEEPTFP